MEDFFYPVYNPDGSLNFEETSKRLFKTVISDPKNGEQFVIENKVANNDVPRPIPTADSGQTVGQLRIAFTPRQPTAENVPIGPMIKIGEALIPAPSADLLKTTPDSAIGQYAKALGLNADAVKGELTYEQRGNLVFAKAKDGTPLFIATQDQKSGEWGWNNLNLRTADEKTGAIYGSEALTGGNDNVRLKVIKEHFNQMTITGLSWKRSQPSEKDLELRIPNSYLKDAIINKQDVTFLHLVYGINSETPDWLRNGNYTKDQLIRIMHDHITNIMTSNRKIVDDAGSNIQLQYSVVNEGVDQPNYFWSSRIGPSYIQSAFQTARTADPKAILIYNDYAHELPTARKTDRVFQVVKELKDKQLIDGVGMQMHFIGKDNLDPNLPIQYLEEGIRSQIKRYGEIGVKVYITELDVDLSKISGSPVEKMQKAAEIYRMIARISSSSSNVAGVSVFGVNSESSWITDLGGKAALLFSNNQPLPTYYATLTGLMEGLK
ncbi:endo-1,4-beta-xylanase, partial [Candidatus Roizmanbacteria bacterium]|nr:endo-1,4-beta-xylanase [Candidatus Roizmanbacteria bacterium]